MNCFACCVCCNTQMFSLRGHSTCCKPSETCPPWPWSILMRSSCQCSSSNCGITLCTCQTFAPPRHTRPCQTYPSTAPLLFLASICQVGDISVISGWICTHGMHQSGLRCCHRGYVRVGIFIAHTYQVVCVLSAADASGGQMLVPFLNTRFWCDCSR